LFHKNYHSKIQSYYLGKTSNFEGNSVDKKLLNSTESNGG